MCTKIITRYTLHGDVDILTPHKKFKKLQTHAGTQSHTDPHTHLMEEGGTDVVEMTEQSEETALLLVVPHLQNNVISKKTCNLVQ